MFYKTGLTGKFVFTHNADTADFDGNSAFDGEAGETAADTWDGSFRGPVAGHHGDEEKIVVIRWDGPHYIGDIVRWDEDGPTRHAGCADDATKLLGHCTGFPETESATTESFHASERGALVVFDEACG